MPFLRNQGGTTILSSLVYALAYTRGFFMVIMNTVNLLFDERKEHYENHIKGWLL